MLTSFQPELSLEDQIAYLLAVQPSLLSEDSPFLVEADRQVGCPPLLHEDIPFIVEADRQVNSPPLLP